MSLSLIAGLTEREAANNVLRNVKLQRANPHGRLL